MKTSALLIAILNAVFACCGGAFAEAKRPNILFAISDDQSWMHAGAYGDKGTRTPAFDRVAREGVLFNYAYCAAPSCAPSRAAIVTGRHIWELEEGGVLFGVLKAKFGAFTLNLQASGYQLGATGKTWGPGRTEGWTNTAGRAYNAGTTQAIFGQAYAKRKLAQRKPGMNATDYAANFDDFLADRDKSKPFFFWYGATEPHQGYQVGAWKKAGKTLDQSLLPGCIPDDPVTRGEFLDYGLEIEHFDQHLARMIDALEKAGELDNTVIVVTSDHGNPMPRSKCNLYDSGTRVPLAIRLPGPGIAKGRQVDDFVSLVDLAPTLLDIAGVKPTSTLSGRSLMPILTSQKSGRLEDDRGFIVTAFERHIICRRDGVGYPMRSIRTHKYAYIRNYEPDRWPAGDPDFTSSHQGFYGDCDRGSSKTFILQNAKREDIQPFYELCFGRRQAEELYDMEKDPHQLNNLAGDANHAKVREELAAKMKEFLVKHNDPRMKGQTPWDTYEFTDKRIFKNPNWRTEGMPTRPRKPGPRKPK